MGQTNILLVDPEKCVGCGLCALACSLAKEGEFSLGKARIQTIWIPETSMNVPMLCEHCQKPVCAEVCPVEAISRNEQTGAIVLDPDLCIGCKMCLIACPFGAISIDLKSKTMIKCDLCDGDPECVKHCVYGALSFTRPEEATYAKRRQAAQRLAECVAPNTA
jgi:carbon-monoxide dehydrogenase iron sulfur subunit